MTIQKVQEYPRCYLPDYLLQRYRKDGVVFFQAGGKNIALKGVSSVPNVITIREVDKVPQWKQAMLVQMGRKSTSSMINIANYRVFPISDIRRFSYDLYEIV